MRIGVGITVDFGSQNSILPKHWYYKRNHPRFFWSERVADCQGFVMQLSLNGSGANLGGHQLASQTRPI